MATNINHLPLKPEEHKEHASPTQQKQQLPKAQDQQQLQQQHQNKQSQIYDAVESSITHNKFNYENNHKDKDKAKAGNRETRSDLSPNADESSTCLSRNSQQKLALSREPTSSSIRLTTSTTQRRRQLQFQRQKETKLYEPHSGDRSSSPSVMGGGKLVNCIAYDDNSLIIERKPSPTSPASLRHYLKAETPTHSSRKYNRKAIKSDLEVVIVKPEHPQHRAPTITLPVPANIVGQSPKPSLSSGPTVLQQRYTQLQQEHEKKFTYNAMNRFDCLEHSNSRNSRA